MHSTRTKRYTVVKCIKVVKCKKVVCKVYKGLVAVSSLRMAILASNSQFQARQVCGTGEPSLVVVAEIRVSIEQCFMVGLGPVVMMK